MDVIQAYLESTLEQLESGEAYTDAKAMRARTTPAANMPSALCRRQPQCSNRDPLGPGLERRG